MGEVMEAAREFIREMDEDGVDISAYTDQIDKEMTRIHSHRTPAHVGADVAEVGGVMVPSLPSLTVGSAKTKSAPSKKRKATDDNNESSTTPKERNRGGRPKGSKTNKSNVEQQSSTQQQQQQHHADPNEVAMLNDITGRYFTEKQKYVSQGRNTPRGTLDNIIASAKEEYNLPNMNVNKSTIQRRLLRKSITVFRNGPQSPAFAIDTPLVELINTRTLQGQTTTPKKGTEMGNALLKEYGLEGRMAQFKLKCNMVTNPDEMNEGSGEMLGKAWWRSFLKRNKERLNEYTGCIEGGGVVVFGGAATNGVEEEQEMGIVDDTLV